MDADRCDIRGLAFGFWSVPPPSQMELVHFTRSGIAKDVRMRMLICTGLVRSPLPTTCLQVASRLLLVWAVVDRFPPVTTSTPFYSSMLLAWSTTEVVRYSYFVLNLRGSVPSFVTWLRYNMFYVLYPIGITSEAVLVWKASEEAGEPWKWVGWGILGLYVPGRSFPPRSWELRRRGCG